jgi:hypothetical protein
MKVSEDFALSILAKLKDYSRSSEIHGVFEAEGGSCVFPFRGLVKAFSCVVIVVFGEDCFELGLRLSDVEFEYEEKQAYPREIRDWAGYEIKGCLVVSLPTKWRCSFCEPSV